MGFRLMRSLSIRGVQGQHLKVVFSLVVAFLAALALRDLILYGTFADVTKQMLLAVGGVFGLFILTDWRLGIYLFLFWLIFEDLARKFLGNNMYVYFGKDVLVALIFAAFAFALMRRRERAFKLPFLLPLMLFAGLGLIHVFNPNSPSIFYGLLGMKLYFFYIPLIFVGYALVSTVADLRRLLIFGILVAAAVAGLGVTQGIVGHEFLSPATLAPELEGLGRLNRVAPTSGVIVTAPSSVFVSRGRFASYMIMMFVLTVGLIGYHLIRPIQRGRLLYLALGLTLLGGFISASRSALVYSVASLFIVGMAIFWGAPRDWQGRAKLGAAMRRGAVALVVCIAIFYAFFPDAIENRWAFYSETLSPMSERSELVHRVRDYPWDNFLQAFDFPNWATGYGIGTASLGVQYIQRYLGAPPLNIGTESGYGAIMLEMGVAGLALWLVLSIAVAIAAWRIVKRLRGTPLFPVGFAIFWFVFLVLFPFTYGGLAAYQNYVLNAHLWLLLGVLFRLPALIPEATSPAPEPVAPEMLRSRPLPVALRSSP
jgi:hypothetical protein